MREQTLDRMIRAGLVAVVVGIAAVAVVYGLHRLIAGGTGPTLVERQLAAGERAIREDPGNVQLRMQFAGVLRAAHRQESALEEYAQVLKVEADNSQAMLERGEVLAEQGAFAQAGKDYETLIVENDGNEYKRVNPTLESAYYNLGLVLLKQHDSAQAMAQEEKALKIEPTDADAWYVMGQAAIQAARYKAAVNALQRAVLYVPMGWCEPYQQLAKAYEGQRLLQQAEYASAMVELCEKRPAEAAQRLERLTSGPARVDAMLGLGMTAEVQSKRATATSWYRKVLVADPHNFDAHVGLARLGAHTGGR